MTDLIIIGAGGFGREMFGHITRINEEIAPTWNFLGFIDDGATDTKEGLAVLGGLEDFLKMDRHIQYFIAIANMEVREKIAKRCKEAGFTSASIIGDKVILSPGCKLGEGIYLGGGCVLKRNAKIGDFCIIQGSTYLGRDTEIGPFTSVMTSSCFGSNVKIGKYNYFGLRCNVGDNVTTTESCTFGACASLAEDAPVPGTYVGVPAKLKKPLVK